MTQNLSFAILLNILIILPFAFGSCKNSQDINFIDEDQNQTLCAVGFMVSNSFFQCQT
jgi:hypothetical protein